MAKVRPVTRGSVWECPESHVRFQVVGPCPHVKSCVRVVRVQHPAWFPADKVRVMPKEFMQSNFVRVG